MYTYDVFWGTSEITWASRWDAYLRMPGGKVHWFSILNSLMVVVVMSCIVAMIMMRTIRRDLQRYEQLLVDSGGWRRQGCGAGLGSGGAAQVLQPCACTRCRRSKSICVYKIACAAAGAAGTVGAGGSRGRQQALHRSGGSCTQGALVSTPPRCAAPAHRRQR